MNDEKATPPAGPGGEGMFDAKGRWIPQKLIKPIDLARHDLVLELAAKAVIASAALAEFKRLALTSLEAFQQLSAEQYGVKATGKGNVTLQSFDGRYKIERQVADRLTFDERLHVAKQLIDECIHEWSAGSRDEIRALVDHAFQVDKKGKISIERVLGLRRLNIEHGKWQDAMRAISDSTQVASSRTYVRFYERIGDTDEYRPINLDLSSV